MQELHVPRRVSEFLVLEFARLNSFSRWFSLLWALLALAGALFWVYFSRQLGGMLVDPRMAVRGALSVVNVAVVILLDRRLEHILVRHYKYLMGRFRLLLFLHHPLPEGAPARPGNLLAYPRINLVAGRPSLMSFRSVMRDFVVQFDQVVDFFTPESDQRQGPLSFYFKLQQVANPTLYWHVVAILLLSLTSPLLLATGRALPNFAALPERFSRWNDWQGWLGLPAPTEAAVYLGLWFGVLLAVAVVGRMGLFSELSRFILTLALGVALLIILDAQLYPLLAGVLFDFHGFYTFDPRGEAEGLIVFTPGFNWGRLALYLLLFWLPLLWARMVVTVASAKLRAVLEMLSR